MSEEAEASSASANGEESGEKSDAEAAPDAVTRRNFRKVQLVGQGNVGNVYLVHSEGLGKDGLFAMKVLSKRDMISRGKVHRVLTEKRILASVDHPFIVTLHYSFQSKMKLYFVMQYCAGGEFFRLLRSQPNKYLLEEDAKFYAAEILLALEYLHVLGYIYRDLKPENILVHASGHVMLADFDLSYAHENFSGPSVLPPPRRRWSAAFVCGSAADVEVPNHRSQGPPAPPTEYQPSPTHRRQRSRASDGPVLDVEGAIAVNKTKSFVGTDEYIAPEVIIGEGYAGTVDWWGYGIVLYEMLYGKTPFEGEDRVDTFAKICDENLKVAFPRSPSTSSRCRSLVRRLLHKDPRKRLSRPGDIRACPFFRGFQWALVRHRKPPIVPDLRHKLDTRHFSVPKAASQRLSTSMDGWADPEEEEVNRPPDAGATAIVVAADLGVNDDAPASPDSTNAPSDQESAAAGVAANPPPLLAIAEPPGVDLFEGFEFSRGASDPHWPAGGIR